MPESPKCWYAIRGRLTIQCCRPAAGPRSAVWQEAENRLHVQKALLALLLG